MDKYLKRYVDDILEDKLNNIGAILITGPKWCGKTTTAIQKANSIIELQSPKKSDSYLQLAAIDPEKLLEGENPRLIDEWQLAPQLWDAVRYSVDKRNTMGLYILTGSTVVDEKNIMHSGTGRIYRLLMRPMSLYESGESNGKISLLNLFDNPDMDINGIRSDLELEDIIFAACRGGWPQCLKLKNKKDQLFVAENYVDNICNSDISNIDGVKRDPGQANIILQEYARCISQLTPHSKMLADVCNNYREISEPTFYKYINALKRLYVIKNIKPWAPNIRSSSKIKKREKKEFIDPSIGIAALNLSPEQLLFDLSTFGFFFETLCIRDLSIYSIKYGGDILYYNDGTLEADAVIQLKDGRYALIKFKLGSNEEDKVAKNLLKLKNLIIKKKKENKINIREPEFLAIITGGELAYTRPDGVKIIPIACLK